MLGRNETSDTELCFRALYAAMLYRIRGEGGQQAVADTVEYISPAIAELASMYGKVEPGRDRSLRTGKIAADCGEAETPCRMEEGVVAGCDNPFFRITDS